MFYIIARALFTRYVTTSASQPDVSDTAVADAKEPLYANLEFPALQVSFIPLYSLFLFFFLHFLSARFSLFLFAILFIYCNFSCHILIGLSTHMYV